MDWRGVTRLRWLIPNFLRRRRTDRSGRSARAAADPFAPPPPADPLAVPPPVDPAAPPPAAPFALPNPFAPPPAAAQPAVIPEGTPAGQNPTPYVGEPVFAPPTFNPTNGSKVGAAKPIYINFARPIADRALAEQAIHISSIPPVPGRFYWTSDTQVRWRPQDFWPAGTVVNIDASGTKSSFTVPEQLVATIDDATHQMRSCVTASWRRPSRCRWVWRLAAIRPRMARITCWRNSPTS